MRMYLKNNKKKTITLRTYDDGLIKVYKKYGFKKSKDEKNVKKETVKAKKIEFTTQLISRIGIALAFVGIILMTVATGSLNTLFFSELYNNAPLFNHFWLQLSFVFILFIFSCIQSIGHS